MYTFVLQKLDELEKEEAQREEAGYYAVPKIEYDQTMIEIKELAKQIRDKKSIMRQDALLIKQSTKPRLPRTALSKNREGVEARASRSRGRSVEGPGGKRQRLDSEGNAVTVSKSRARSDSKVTPRDQSGLRDPQVLMKVKKIAHKAIAKKVGKWGLKGEGDRFIGTKKPKHLFSGKRGIGKTDRR
ncbi:nucleolar GTP-binding protein 1-like [Diaphorina citri]|uniref:Nucleolar GTP-binding protein 1-like n=1 Tax=Diaphorina citri TaxID=121845 RepID=A0A3Q0J7E5_DIACI|nr:nucleolar GTP-binding protein 1-like [Diaphorina citri]